MDREDSSRDAARESGPGDSSHPPDHSGPPPSDGGPPDGSGPPDVGPPPDAPVPACALGPCVTLVSPETGPGELKIDSKNVYFITTSAVVQAPISGGAPTTLATGVPVHLAIDSANVYWTDGKAGTLLQTPIGGGTITTLTSAEYPTGVASDGSFVYFTTAGYGFDMGTVATVPVGGGAIKALATLRNYPGLIATDGSNVYWVDDSGGTVTRTPVTGGLVTTLATGQSDFGALAIDATNVYWTSPPAGTFTGSVMQVAIAGGSLVTLSAGLSSYGVAVDSASVYWTDGPSGSVVAAPIGGGTTTTLASGFTYTAGVAVNATSLFFSADGTPGSVLSAPK